LSTTHFQREREIAATRKLRIIQTKAVLKINKITSTGLRFDLLSFEEILRNITNEVVIVIELAKAGKRNTSIKPASEKIRLKRFSS
jgi:hypothetical protein